MHNALVGAGLRDRIRVGASGKVAAGNDIVKRLIQGADYTNSARAMMMAAGCIQAQRCNTDKCPSGVATQNHRRARALDVRRQERAGAPLPGGHGRVGRQDHGRDGLPDPRRPDAAPSAPQS